MPPACGAFAFGRHCTRTGFAAIRDAYVASGYDAANWGRSFMFRSLRPSTDIIEKRRHDTLEPAHSNFFKGKSNPLRLILQARHDFLSIWRKTDYENKVTGTKLLGRQLVLVNSPDAIRYVVAKRHQNFERKTPQMRRALEF